MKLTSCSPSRQRSAFTLVELMVSMSIIVILLLILVSLTSATGRTWTYTTSKVEQFREARGAFEAITRRLSQATLNTYWDYDHDDKPKLYVRQSELRFISGPMATLSAGGNTRPTHGVFFQAPLGFVSDQTHAPLANLLNTWGYFVEFGSDQPSRPEFLNDESIAPYRYRFRLKEMMVPTENFNIYDYTSGSDAQGNPRNLTYKGLEWFSVALKSPNPPVRVLAENIIALFILPKLPPEEDRTGTALAPEFLYDTTAGNAVAGLNPKNQLPPIVQVTMVAIAEDSYARYYEGSSQPDFGLDGRFETASQFDINTNGGAPGDLEALEATLQEKKLNYRVFTTNVSIRAAKWSREQKN